MKRKVLRYSLYIVGCLVILLIVFFASTELTSSPNFCSTCHYMEPYVEGWKASTHADVTCTDCHFPPGFKSKMRGKFTAASMVVNYITGIYKKSKPWAEITDESCLRSGCHSERVLEGKTVFKQSILFDHKPHLTELRREKELRCTSCHSQIVQGDHITVTESTCFLCHFKNQPEDIPIDDCSWCHAAPIESLNILDEKYDHTFVLTHSIDCKKCHGQMQVGDGIVPKERCSQCHAEIEHIEKYDDVEFIHKKHVTDHKVECQICHLVIQHKSISKSPEIMPDCISCHQSSHQAQLDLFSGTGGLRVRSHPNPMWEDGLNCQACHVFHQYDGINKTLGETLTANPEACEICHGQGYNTILNQWKQLMAEKIDYFESDLDVVQEQISAFKGSETSKKHAFVLVDEAKFNFQLVKNGNIVHNVAYSDELLLSSYKNLKRALNTIKSDHELHDLTLYSELIPSECKNCHYGQEEIDVEAFGISFSHNIHIMKNRLPCSKCHSNLNRHGELTMARKDCLSCHHNPEEGNCGRCHETQTQIYAGTIAFAEEEIPDIMFEEDVGCRDCHEQDQVIKKAVSGSCLECHDEEYEDLLAEWQDETRETINIINRALISIEYDHLSKEQQLRIDQINFGIKKITADKSFGAHNIELISQTLDQYRAALINVP